MEALIGIKPTLENEVNANCLDGLQDGDRRIQKKIQEKFDQKSLNDLPSQAINGRERARFQSLLTPNAGAWLTKPPISTLGLHVEAEEFQNCLKFRLGIPIYDAPRNCPFYKNSVIDIYGDHSLTCGGRGDTIHRHDRLRDKVFSSCVTASLSPSLEKKNLSSNNQSYPADVFLPSWKQGKTAPLDSTVLSSLQSCNQQALQMRWIHPVMR